jgi:thymidylate synthase
MHVLTAHNVNIAYARGLRLVSEKGIKRESRNGFVRVVPEPVTTHYNFPTERVLFDPQRNANPFFHLFEALWMLTGANDVALPAYFVPNVKNFSDDGVNFHAAYGARWRNHFGARMLDQLSLIVEILKNNPDDRRCVLTMWDPDADLGWEGKDFPCNVSAKFELDSTHTRLNMVVFNRSNDVVWGCYGANVVQFSVLQEFLAARLAVYPGWYEQISTNFHVYEDMWAKVWPRRHDVDSPYQRAFDWVTVSPLVTVESSFLAECETAIQDVRSNKVLKAGREWENRFFPNVVAPLAFAYSCYRDGSVRFGIDYLQEVIAASGRIDWLVAAREWLQRIEIARTTETG